MKDKLLSRSVISFNLVFSWSAKKFWSFIRLKPSNLNFCSKMTSYHWYGIIERQLHALRISMKAILPVNSIYQQYSRFNGNHHYKNEVIPTYLWKIAKNRSKIVLTFRPNYHYFDTLFGTNQSDFQLEHVTCLQ